MRCSPLGQSWPHGRYHQLLCQDFPRKHISNSYHICPHPLLSHKATQLAFHCVVGKSILVSQVVCQCQPILDCNRKFIPHRTKCPRMLHLKQKMAKPHWPSFIFNHDQREFCIFEDSVEFFVSAYMHNNYTKYYVQKRSNIAQNIYSRICAYIMCNTLL